MGVRQQILDEVAHPVGLSEDVTDPLVAARIQHVRVALLEQRGKAGDRAKRRREIMGGDPREIGELLVRARELRQRVGQSRPRGDGAW